MSQGISWYQFVSTAHATDVVIHACSEQRQHTNTLISSLSSPSVRLALPALRGISYGDGFFTTMGVHKGEILWQSYHQQRLNNHLQALDLDLSTTQQTMLFQEATKFADNTKYGIIKIIVTRQTQPLRGYAYSSQHDQNGCVVWVGVMPSVPLATQMASFLNGSCFSVKDTPILQQAPIVAACLESKLACHPPTLAGLKSLNRLDNVLAAGELEKRKQVCPELADGLVQDMMGNWVEGVMSNVFYQLAGYPNQWYTPPIVCSGVRGVMRHVIIDMLISSDRPVQERVLQDKDLTRLSAMFFCNAVRGVIPVKELRLADESLLLATLPAASI